METITSVNSYTKNDKPMVVFNDKYFLAAAFVTKLTGLNGMFHLLVGSTISATFYKLDDEITPAKDGKTAVLCTKEETIVKDAKIELTGQLLAYSMAAAFGTVVSVK